MFYKFMNACIYAIMNKRKCDICNNSYKKIIDLPININQDHYDTNKLSLCQKCLQNLVDNKVLTIVFEKLHVRNTSINKNKKD
jgi:hypothetical protein